MRWSLKKGAWDYVSRVVTVGLPFSASPGGRSCIMPKLGLPEFTSVAQLNCIADYLGCFSNCFGCCCLLVRTLWAVLFHFQLNKYVNVSQARNTRDISTAVHYTKY